MRFAIELTRDKKPVKAKLMNAAAEGSVGWRSIIREAFTGAWQRNIVETQESVIGYPTLYACIARIVKDAGKLTFLLKEKDSNGIWREVENSAYTPVLRKPNHYQTQSQFREAWILSKLLQGNAYILKQRDNRGVVVKLYVLDPTRVKPLVAESGDVFYELWSDRTNLINNGEDTVIVPAREIIHDREITMHHHLIGVPPLAAAYWPAVKNLRILRNASDFFGNGAQPGGILVAPGAIDETTAAELKAAWDESFTGENAGNVAILSDGLKFEALTGKSVDSQMVEQLRYSDEQICQPFGMPPFKIGIGALPAGAKVDDINNLYFSDALQDRIEHMENLLDEGLGIARPMGVECDLWPLLRMDQQKLADFEVKLVGGKLKTPDEGRRAFDLAPIAGGNTLWGQHQDYPLGMLAERSDLNPVEPPAPNAPTPTTSGEDDDEDEVPDDEARSILQLVAA